MYQKNGISLTYRLKQTTKTRDMTPEEINKAVKVTDYMKRTETFIDSHISNRVFQMTKDDLFFILLKYREQETSELLEALKEAADFCILRGINVEGELYLKIKQAINKATL